MINVDEFINKKVAFLIENIEDLRELLKYNDKSFNVKVWLKLIGNYIQFKGDPEDKRWEWCYKHYYEDYNYEIRKFSELYVDVKGFEEVEF